MTMYRPYRPFVSLILFWSLFWAFTGGFLHAYLLSPDWGVMDKGSVSLVLSWRPFWALLYAGMCFGIYTDVASYFCATVVPDKITILIPGLVGAAFGALQGYVVVLPVWGFSEDIVFRGLIFRVVAGAIIGALLAYLPIVNNTNLRNRCGL